MQKKHNKIAGVIVLLVLLVLVRLFEEHLFYDPLIAFFKSDSKTLPEYNPLRLYAGLAFRYWLNTLLSVGIISLLFTDKNTVKLAALLYMGLFILLMMAFYVVTISGNTNLLVLFYIRRFLIQPLFLILFVPAFYYQKKMKQNQ